MLSGTSVAITDNYDHREEVKVQMVEKQIQQVPVKNDEGNRIGPM
jgi:hypothetical protein